MNIQANVRIRKLVQNGTTTRPRRRFFHRRGARTAIHQATGKLISRQSAVVSTAIHSDRQAIER